MSLPRNATLNPLAPFARVAPHVQWHMIQAAFAPMLQPAPPLLLSVIGGFGAYMATGRFWFVAWALVALSAILICRQCAVSMSRSKRNVAPAFWAARYMACAWGEAAIVGAGGALAVAQGDMIACAIMMGPLGFTAAQAAGGAVFSRAAQGQALLFLAPLAVASLAAGSPALMALGIIAALQCGWAIAISAQIDSRADGTSAPAARAFEAPPPTPVVCTNELSFQEQFGRDPCTGLPNKPRFLYLVAQEGLRAVQSAAPLSLMLIQCDVPELVSPRAHAQASRNVLAARAKRLQSVLWRPGDTLGSFDEGRFAVLLPFTDAMGSATVARKLRTAMLELSAEGEDGTSATTTTLSIGMATYVGYGAVPKQLFEFAEQALINARRCGGDQACRYDSMVETLRPTAYRPAAPAIVTEQRSAAVT